MRADKPLSNEELYDSVAELAGIPKSALDEQSEIGKANGLGSAKQLR
ncbi:hypothetical protein [Photorhabdus sp. RM71S]